MEQRVRVTLITTDLRPAYWDDFHCIMGDCRLNCCKFAWNITFGRKNYLTLKKQKCTPELETRLKRCLRRTHGRTSINSKEDVDYARFVLEHEACPMLNEDGLCMLQREKGADILPKVCRVFPRGESYKLSGHLERSLSLACEGVLALLWELPEGVNFRSDPLPKEQQTWMDFRYGGSPFAPYFQDIRSLCIDFLQNRRYPLPQRILLMGMALKELVDGETNISRWIKQGNLLMETADLTPLLDNTRRNNSLELTISQNVQVIMKMTGLGSHGQKMRSDMVQWLGVQSDSDTRSVIETKPFLSAQKRYQTLNPEYFLENVMVALFFHLALPDVTSTENLWKSYVNFCNLYSVYHFLAIMACREGVEDIRSEMFRLLVVASRGLIHNRARQAALRDELFQHDSATLAHMAILLSE